MAYSTVVKMKTSYPRLESTNATSETLFSWLSRASNYIDGYIAQVVTLPLSPTPPLLEALSEDLGYAMFMRRHVTDLGKERGLLQMWDDIHRVLDQMRAGEIDIVGSDGATVTLLGTTPLVPWSSLRDYTPTFGVGDITDAVVDPERLDQEDSDRS